jgi:predicted 2-oxoglutarate/Fe(II)-dependent dioxygenase YbiX
MSNSNRIFLETYSLGRQSNLNYWDLLYSVDVEEGDIIIFPSTLEHLVQPQTTDESRITISFNIRALPIEDI